MSFIFLGAAVILIPAGMAVVGRSKRISDRIRDKLGNADEIRRHKEDNLPENNYVRDINAVVAGFGFMIFLSGLVMVVMGMGAVR